MIMAIDAMCNRYGLLPGELMSRASTFDLFIYDAAASYIRHAQDKADGKAGDIPQETLLEIVKNRAKAQ
jgi:hypothetical protein